MYMIWTASLASMVPICIQRMQLIANWTQKRIWEAWWRHQMEAFSALLAICAGNSPVPVNSPRKGQWRGALMFSLIYARINGWVNNCEAGDLRRHRAHYDAIPAIPRRYDDPDTRDIYRDKIDRVNVFLQHKCKKSSKLHFCGIILDLKITKVMDFISISADLKNTPRT